MTRMDCEGAESTKWVGGFGGAEESVEATMEIG